MDLTQYVEALRRGLASAAAAGTDETRRTAELLTESLEPSIRLAFMDALSSAADEITNALTDITVEVRLRGFDPEVVVTAREPETEQEPEPPAEGDESLARISLRLPETLKSRVENAAAKEGISVNAWLVGAVSRALSRSNRPSHPGRPGRPGGTVTGYVRG